MNENNRVNTRKVKPFNDKTIRIIVMMTLMSITANMAHPVTPKLTQALDFNSFQYGVIFATMAIANLFASALFGRLSDDHGRKLFLIIGPIGYGLAQIGFGFSEHFLLILLFRFIAGASASAVFVSGMAYLVDVTTRENRSKAMSYYTSILGFGMTMGYLLGGGIGNKDFHYAFVAQSIASILIGLTMFLYVKESHTEREARTVKTTLFKDLKKYSHTILPVLLVAVILTSFTTIGFNNSFNLYMSNKEYLNLDTFEIGRVMAVTGVIGLFTNIVLFPLLKRKFNDAYVLALTIFTMVATLIMLTLTDNLTYKIIILIPFFGALKLYKPLLQSIISKLGTRNGEVMGLNNAANAIGMVLGSLIAGAFFDIGPNYSILSVAVTSLLAGLLVLIAFKRIVKVG